jgi:hypothetical protein
MTAMTPNWYFARWRHLLMQMAMWLALGASVALAAMLDYHLRRGQIVTLSTPVTDGSLTFQLPGGWKSWTRQSEGDATAHVATDSVAGITRSLIISRQRVPHTMAPAEYILRALPITGNLKTDDFKGLVIDGWPGQSITWASHRGSLAAGEEFQFTNCSAIVLPGNEAIMIHMDKNAPFDAADERLYRQVLENIHISTPGPTDGGTIQLDTNITVAVPSDIRLYPQADPLCSERSVAQITDGNGWISAEFLPVAVPENQPSPSLLAGLAAREQLDPFHASLANAWLTADVAAQAPNHWTITPQENVSDAVSPRRIAHLLTGDGGWGVIVILSAEPPASLKDLEHLWEELSGNIRLGKKMPTLGAELAAGSNVASSAALPAHSDNWWMWLRGAVPVGFTQDFADHDGKYVFRYTVRRNWNGTATAVLQRWGLSDETGPWSRMIRSDAEANLNDPQVPLFDQTTTIGDTITTIIHDRGGHENSADSPRSTAFLLSRYLPWTLIRVGASPSALWTDRFPGVEAELFPSPLLLLANRIQAGTIQTQVNGTGRLAQWNFRADGTFDHADFEGDLHLRPSSQAEVEAAFAGDHRLTTQLH